jgi:hypothetical protein
VSAAPAPRRTSHRGFVPASGFWFDPALLGADRMAGRILSLWSEGSLLHEAAGGVLLVLPSPVLVDSRRAPGVVLTRRDGLLAGFPATDREIARLDPPPGSALLCREGRIRVCPLSRQTILDPAAWLDVEGLAEQASQPLGDPPAPAAAARGLEPPPLESHFDPEFTRPPEKKAKLLAALAEALSKKDAGARGPGRAPRGSGAGLDPGAVWVFIRRLALAALLLLFFRSASDFAVRIIAVLIGYFLTIYLFRPGRAAFPAPLKEAFLWWWGSRKARRARKASAPRPGTFHRSRPASWLGRRLDAARGVLGALLGRTPAARLLGRRQARYMHEMTSMFEENDLDNALRHAVPLATLGEMMQAAGAFFRPKPRADLSIGPGPGRGPGRVILLSDDYHAYLVGLYRAACSRLERAGQIEKAAFVLLELLKKNEEAIALLERHGRFRFAAEVAQARGLPPGMVIRLWFLAGEPAQAMRVARTTGAFADAVSRLERTHPDEAKKMRVLWGSFLAEAGNYGGAVDAAWPVAEARRLLLEWIERGIRLEGPIAARLIVKKIALEPEALEALLPKIGEILHDTLPGSLRAKLSLGKAILEHEDRQDLRALSGFVLRHLIKDLHAVPFNPGFGSVVQGLKKATSDRLLVEDLPSHAFPIAAAGPKASLVLRRDAADVGLHRLRDGVCLPSGRLVVALGEGGVQVLSRRGALIAHIDQPADELVLNDSGNQAIAVARRGRVSRLARLDLEKLRGHYWCDALVDRAAETFDGEVWFVSHGDELMAVDALADRFESIWRVGDLMGPVIAIARNASSLSLIVIGLNGPEYWRYELPALVLRQRLEISVEGEFAGIWEVTAKEHYGLCRSELAASEADRERFVIHVGTKDEKSLWHSRELEGTPWSFKLYHNTAAVTTRTAEGQRVSFFRWPGPMEEPAVEIELAGAADAAVRRYANTFCATDDRGRLLVLSAEDFRLIREARL